MAMGLANRPVDARPVSRCPSRDAREFLGYEVATTAAIAPTRERHRASAGLIPEAISRTAN